MPKKLFITGDSSGAVKVGFRQIVYLSEHMEYVKLVTSTDTYLLSCSINDFQKRLPGKKFYRVHRKYIIARRYIQAFDKEKGYVLIRNHKKRDDCATPEIKIPIDKKFEKILAKNTIVSGRKFQVQAGLSALLFDLLFYNTN